jgi:hypothetical protein
VVEEEPVPPVSHEVMKESTEPPVKIEEGGTETEEKKE